MQGQVLSPLLRTSGQKGFYLKNDGLNPAWSCARSRATGRHWAALPGLRARGQAGMAAGGGCSPAAARWGREPPRSNQGQSCYLTGAAPLCFLLLQPHPHFFLWTDHFPFGTEEGMALQVLIELVLGNVGKHFIVDLVCRAVGYPERQNETSCLGHCCAQGRSTSPSSDLPASTHPGASSCREGRGSTGALSGFNATPSQSRGVDATGLSVREAQSNSRSHGVNHVHHTQRQERRENVSPCGKGQVREGKDCSVPA